MATIDESDFTKKQVDVKDHFAALQRTMIQVQKIDTETISSQLGSLSEVMGSSLTALAEGKLKDKDHLDLQKYLDKLGVMAEESANVIKAFNAYTKEVANSKDEEEALGKMIDANQASMKKINALEKEREDLINKVNNHNSITEELSNKINNVLERREQYQETSNNLVQKYNDKIEQVEQKLKAENLGQQDIAKLQQEKINLETKIGDVKDRTNRFLQNSISLHEDLKTKLQQQQQLYEDAPNLVESINSKLREEIAFNDIIKKDLEQFSEGMEEFGLMTDKSRKTVQSILKLDKDINKELKVSNDESKKITNNLGTSNDRMQSLASETSDFANEMNRAATEAERALKAMSASKRRGKRGGGLDSIKVNSSNQAEFPTPAGNTTKFSADFVNIATAGMTMQPKGMNSGGYISGPNGKDVIPAMLTNGEYVINASATKKFLPLLEKINSGQIQSFASGGMVGKNPWVSSINSNSEKHLANMETHLKDVVEGSDEQIKNQVAANKLTEQSLASKQTGKIIDDKKKTSFYMPDKEGLVSMTEKIIGEPGEILGTKDITKNINNVYDFEKDDIHKKHFIEGDASMLEKIADNTKKAFYNQKLEENVDLSKVNSDTYKDEIYDSVKANVKAFEKLHKSIQTETEVKNKIQGLTLKEGEVAGINSDRSSALEKALSDQSEAINFLKNAGVVDDDFDKFVDEQKLDKLLDSITGDNYVIRKQIDGAKKSNLYNTAEDLRKIIGETKSSVQFTEEAQGRDITQNSNEKLLEKIHEEKGLQSFKIVGDNASFEEMVNATIEYRTKEQFEKEFGGGNKNDLSKNMSNSGVSDWVESYKEANNIILKARNEANKAIYNIEAKAAKFGASRYAELNDRQNAFWESSATALNDSHEQIKKAVLEVAEAGEEGKRKLEQLAMQTTQTFSLIGNDLPTNLLNVRDATIDTLTSLKDATKGGLLGVDLDSEIDKLEELQRDQMQNLDSILSTKNNLTDSEGAFKLMADPDKIVRSAAISNIYDMMASQMSGNQHETQRLAGLLGRQKANNEVKGLSTGGFVSGPMGRDVIPAMLTDGEFVIRADVAKKWRGFLEHLNNKGHLGMYNGGPVMLADGGAPGGGGGGGGPGGGGGGGPDLAAMQKLLSENNAEVQSMSFIFSEIVETVKKYNEEGKTADQINQFIKEKTSDIKEMLDEELELQDQLVLKTSQRLQKLKAIKELKLAGVHDAILGAFTAVEEKIDGIVGSIPIVGSTLAMSIKASTGPAFEELRQGASDAFLDMADEFNNSKDFDKAFNVGMGKFKESASNAGKHMQMIGSLAKKIGPGMIAAGAAAFGFVALLGLAVKRFFELEEQQEEFRKGLGLMASTAKPIENMARNAQKEFAAAGVELEHAFNAATSLTTELGTTHLVSQEAVKTISLMEAGLGLSADTAAGAYDMFKLMGSSSGESAENLMKATASLADAAGVPLDAVMNDIANASEDTQKFMKGNAKQMMIAAVQARRLGVSMDSITGAMSQALDIESSISEEMRLASMLGKHINLNAMRRASFEGDAEKVMQEQLKALKNMGGTDAMNPYQLEQAAKALGLSVEEMIKMEKHEKGLQALKNGTAEQQKMYNDYTAMQNQMKKDGVKSAAEEAEERIKAQQAELVKANIMAKVNSLMTDLGEVLLPMVEAGFKIIMPILDVVFFVLKGIVSVVEFLLSPVTLLADGISYVADEFGSVGKVILTVAGLLVGLPLLIGAFGGSVTGVLGILKTGILSVGGYIKKAFSAEGLSTFKDSMSSMFSAGLEGAKGLGGALLDAVKNPVDTVKSIGDSLAGLGEKGKDMMAGMLGGGGGGAPGTGAFGQGGASDQSKKGGMMDKVKGMFGGGDKSKGGEMVPDVDPKKGDKFKKFLDAFNKIDMGKLIKASAALLILSGALFVSAKAFQAFSKVSWDGVAKGILGLTALVVASKFLEKGSTSMIKGAAAIAVLGIALLPAALAFQMFSSVNWAGVLAGMVALGVLAVMAIVLGNLIVPIAMGAAAIALLGLSLIPFGVAALFAGVGAMLIASAFTVMVSALQLLTFEDIAKIMLLGATFVGFGVMIPFIILGAAALGIMGGALLAFSFSAFFASVGIAALAVGFALLSASIATISENGIAVLLSLGMIGLLAPMFFVASAGILMLAGAIGVMSAALLGASIMSIFSSDDPFAMYINLGENADKLDTAAKGLKNIASSMSALSDVDAEDILEDIADGMEDLFDEIEDIEMEAINKFTSIGTSFGLIGDGMKEIKKGISPFKDLITLMSDPANYEAAIVGINALTLALTDLCSVIQSLGESELGILGVASAEGGGEGGPSTQDMAGGGAGAIPMTDVVQQVASVPAAPGMPIASGESASNAGVEERLDELISLMKSGKLGVNLDGKKVEKQLAKAAP